MRLDKFLFYLRPFLAVGALAACLLVLVLLGAGCAASGGGPDASLAAIKEEQRTRLYRRCLRETKEQARLVQDGDYIYHNACVEWARRAVR